MTAAINTMHALAPSAASGAALAPPSQDLETQASVYIAQEKFSRKFILPATDAHDELTVTYAVGGVDSDAVPTVLFIGGMFGGRLLASLIDHVAQNLGMRIVVVDRPGMGGSTLVDVSLRLSVWLETVPVLMRTINAQHISIAAHSCGVIYALNTIYELPWILPPCNRNLYLFSPWVNLEHSGITMLSITSYLPSLVINQFDTVVRCVNSSLTSAVRFSGILSSSASVTANQESYGSGGSEREMALPRHERNEICREYCGVSAAEYSARSKELMNAMFRESTSGANHEALLCLRKDITGGWGVCDDLQMYPDILEAKLRKFSTETVAGKPQMPSQSESAIFTIKTLWAEKDELIKKKGEEYFNACFARYSNASGHDNKCLGYGTEIVSETSHNTVFMPQYEALSRVLNDMLERKN